MNIRKIIVASALALCICLTWRVQLNGQVLVEKERQQYLSGVISQLKDEMPSQLLSLTSERENYFDSRALSTKLIAATPPTLAVLEAATMGIPKDISFSEIQQHGAQVTITVNARNEDNLENLRRAYNARTDLDIIGEKRAKSSEATTQIKISLLRPPSARLE